VIELTYAASAVTLGAVVGLALALTGAGGGILAVPMLLLILHLDVAQAAPVGLLAVGLATALGAVLGLREGTVRYKAALLIGGAGMLAAPVGVALAQRLPNAPLTTAFAAVLGWVARNMYRCSRAPAVGQQVARRSPPCVLNERTGRLVWTRPCAQVLGGTGLLSGLLSGLLGVGGGFVIVPSLTHYSNLTAEGIVCTSLAVIALVSVSGVASAAAHGAVDWSLAVPFGAGAAFALLLIRQYARRWSGPRLQRSFSILCLVVAVILLIRGIRSLIG